MVDGKHVGTSGNTIPLLDTGNTWSYTNLFNSGFGRKTDIISTDIILDETYYRIIVNSLATITLPTAVGITGFEYNIIRTGTGNVTITPNGAETINGYANLVLTEQWSSVVIVSDGVNWVRCS